LDKDRGLGLFKSLKFAVFLACAVVAAGYASRYVLTHAIKRMDIPAHMMNHKVSYVPNLFLFLLLFVFCSRLFASLLVTSSLFPHAFSKLKW
jgi:hypothetical protein